MIQARGPEATIATILVPTDFSPCSREALTYAALGGQKGGYLSQSPFRLLSRINPVPFNQRVP